MTLKKHYALERDERAYNIDSINDQVVRIGTRILGSKWLGRTTPSNVNQGWLHVLSSVRKEYK